MGASPVTQLPEAKRSCLRFLESGDRELLAPVAAAAPYSLIRWLDESGLALYFYRQCQLSDHGLPDPLKHAFVRREACNRVRVDAMLDDFRTVVGTLNATGVPFAVIKGFSLAPEFCPDIHLRHHADTDLLLRREDYPTAISALNRLGYLESERDDFDELLLAIPSTYVPIAGEFLYSGERQKRVELHSSYCKHAAGSVDPLEWLTEVRSREILDLRFPVLSLETMFVAQVLHAFRHVLGGWVRLSWLWEIAYCARERRSSSEFWRSITDRLRDSGSAPAAGTLFLLMDRIFPDTAIGSLFPEIVESIPEEAKAWVQSAGAEFLLQEFPGTYCPVRSSFEAGGGIGRRIARAVLRRLRRVDEYLIHHPDRPITLKRDLEKLGVLAGWRIRRTFRTRARAHNPVP